MINTENAGFKPNASLLYDPLRYDPPFFSDIKTPKYDVIGIFLTPSPWISNRGGVYTY